MLLLIIKRGCALNHTGVFGARKLCRIRLCEKLRLYLVDRNIKQAHLSLSDEKFNAVALLEQHPLAVSSYQTAKKFGCEGTKREAYKAGFAQYIN
jgi:hypothetical protein